MHGQVRHRRVAVGPVDTFFREAGPPDAPVILLPHGYPCSSYEFRNLMPRLADRWRLIAPDFPGAGYSSDPVDFDYSFDGYAEFLDRFVETLALRRFVLYLHDFGSPIGARLAIKAPERILAMILQNADVPYEDALGPKYAEIERTWDLPPKEMREALAKAINKATFRQEFENGTPAGIIDRLPPDLWELHWALMTPQRKQIATNLLAGLEQNRAWFPQHRHYLKTHRPTTLIVWGPHDEYMPEISARAYLRDLPDAELHLLDGGHWLLETHLDEVVDIVGRFLERVAPAEDAWAPSARAS